MSSNMHAIVEVSALAGVCLLAGCSAGRARPAATGMPVVPVSVAVAAKEPVPAEVRAVGTAEPYASVQVKSQIGGQLLRARFTEGGNVNQGDLLLEIDPRPYQEALRQAEAAVSRDGAQLRQAEANLGRDQAQAKNADAEAARYQELLKLGIAARNQYEPLRANADALGEAIRADRAAIESARAMLESDRAAVERAKLDLGYCEIRSPVAGRAGNLLIQAGNLVKANDAAIVVINQVTPMFVSFGVPERYLGEVRARSAGGKLLVEAVPSDAPQKKASGTLSVVDNTVDAATGTIRLKAVFDNRERLLWPGQFVQVMLRLDTREGVVVPAEAVQAGQQGQFVYVVKPDQTVEFRLIAAGAAVSGKMVIEKGVAAGETVVTDGQLRLFPGARIRPVPAALVDAEKL